MTNFVSELSHELPNIKTLEQHQDLGKLQNENKTSKSSKEKSECPVFPPEIIFLAIAIKTCTKSDLKVFSNFA